MDSLLFYCGLGAAVIALLSGIIILFAFFLKKSKLDKDLTAEYGEEKRGRKK